MSSMLGKSFTSIRAATQIITLDKMQFGMVYKKNIRLQDVIGVNKG